MIYHVHNKTGALTPVEISQERIDKIKAFINEVADSPDSFHHDEIPDCVNDISYEYPDDGLSVVNIINSILPTITDRLSYEMIDLDGGKFVIVDHDDESSEDEEEFSEDEDYEDDDDQDYDDDDDNFDEDDEDDEDEDENV